MRLKDFMIYYVIMKHYFITLKSNDNPNPDMEYYAEFMLDLLKRSKQCVITHYCYEVDKQKSKLHFHCVIRASYVRLLDFTTRLRKLGCYAHCVQLETQDDINAVINYMSKGPLNPYQCEQHTFAREIQLSDYPFTQA